MYYSDIMDISRQSLAQRFAALPRVQREAWLAAQEPEVLEEIVRGEWWWLARKDQIPPPGDWLIYLILAGRGFGKSRSGSEWMVDRTQLYPVDRHGAPTEHLVVAETLSDARTICMEGPAGILRVLGRRKIDFKYIKSPKPMIQFPSGSKIYCEGADDEDVGRGYNLASIWGDEVCKWPNAYGSWYEGILPGLRADLADDHPRAFITTTPKPNRLLKEWLDDSTSEDSHRRSSVIVVRGSTFDNATNLSSQMLTALENRYKDTDLGRQELHGEMLDDQKGALFKASDLNAARVTEAPTEDIISIIVGVDPAQVDDAGEVIDGRRGNRRSEGSHDEMGVVVVARTKDDDLWVLADESIQSAGRPAALHVWRTMIKWNATLVVYESNVGKHWMHQVFTDAYKELQESGEMPENTTPPMEGVDAKLGKKTRAEPVALRSQQKRIHMVGRFGLLEDQLTTFTSWDGKESPDHLDAFVHACRKHMLNERRRSRIIGLDDIKRDNRTDDGLGDGWDFRAW